MKGRDIRIRASFDGKDHGNKSYRTTFYFEELDTPRISENHPRLTDSDPRSKMKELTFYDGQQETPELTIRPDTMQYFYEEKEMSQRVFKMHKSMNLLFKYTTYLAAAVAVYGVWFHF